MFVGNLIKCIKEIQFKDHLLRKWHLNYIVIWKVGCFYYASYKEITVYLQRALANVRIVFQAVYIHYTIIHRLFRSKTKWDHSESFADLSDKWEYPDRTDCGGVCFPGRAYLCGTSCGCAGGSAGWSSCRTRGRSTAPAAWEASASLTVDTNRKEGAKRTVSDRIQIKKKQLIIRKWMVREHGFSPGKKKIYWKVWCI